MEVVLYIRSGCHLCDLAEQILLGFKAQYCFRLEIVDIDEFSELNELYNEMVPVVCMDEIIIAKAPINLVDLQNAFELSS